MVLVHESKLAEQGVAVFPAALRKKPLLTESHYTFGELAALYEQVGQFEGQSEQTYPFSLLT